MHICVIGSGISGLAAAHYLSAQPETTLTVLESSLEPGGRARVSDGDEHCTRIFIGDYSHTFQILREVPSGSGSIADAMRPLRRFVWTSSKRWVEISHVYAAQARELPLRERWKMLRTSRPSLLAAKRSKSNSNSFGTGTTYSLRSALRLVRNLRGSRTAFVLPGRTDELLVNPWVRHLESRGVTIRTGSPVERLAVDGDGVDVHLGASVERYDAVLVTAFVHDAYGLLDRSGIPRRLDCRRHLHCRCFTVELDPREPLLGENSQLSFTTTGLMIVVQPEQARCIALTTTLPSTAESFVVGLIVDRLGLRFAPTRVGVRDNLDPSDGVFVGEQVDPTSLEDAVSAQTGVSAPRRVYFAGSYTASSYGIDSAESACRSALSAIERMVADRPAQSLLSASPKHGGASGLSAVGTRVRRPRHTPRAHPNFLERPRTTASAWRLLGLVGALGDALSPAVAPPDHSGIDWPASSPVVFVVRTRGREGLLAVLLAFGRLHASPRLVLPEHSFVGPAGPALALLGALPAILGSNATPNALVAAVRAGDSVAFGAGESDDLEEASCELAAATAVPLVPLLLSAGSARSAHASAGGLSPPRRGRKPRTGGFLSAIQGSWLGTAVLVGSPVSPEGRDATELRRLTRLRFLELADPGAPREVVV